jgi:hypothetical protein
MAEHQKYQLLQHPYHYDIFIGLSFACFLAVAQTKTFHVLNEMLPQSVC